jgi:O-antigen ligase
VQLADGLRVLRAYGTLPHPNILAGFVLFLLLGPASLFLISRKTNYPALFLFSLGVILLTLTFSRSAWLGLLGFLSILLWKANSFDRKRLGLFFATCLLTIVLALYPLRALVWTRVSNAPVATEQLSTFGREWLTQQAFDMFQANPLMGVGIGSFVLELSTYAMQGAMIEPAHSIPLLAMAELGIFGLLLVLGFFIAIASRIIKVHSQKSILASGMIAGLVLIGLFDHYLWTLAPGRVLLGLALGLWMGQISYDA